MKRISNDGSVSPKTILKDYQRYFHLGTLNHVTTETNITYEPTSLHKVVFQTYVTANNNGQKVQNRFKTDSNLSITTYTKFLSILKILTISMQTISLQIF